MLRSPLQAGQKYKFTSHMYNPVGLTYKPDDILELIEPTEKTPHGHKSILGNWICKCPHQTSVWSSVWMLVDRGYLVKHKEPDSLIKQLGFKIFVSIFTLLVFASMAYGLYLDRDNPEEFRNHVVLVGFMIGLNLFYIWLSWFFGRQNETTGPVSKSK